MADAVIFDFNGTLVVSVDQHTRAWHETFSEFGHELACAHLREQIGKETSSDDPEAAAKAGPKTIGVLCGGLPAESLSAARCIAVSRDPAGPLAQYDDSLFAH